MVYSCCNLFHCFISMYLLVIPNNKSKEERKIIIGVIIGGVIALLIISGIIYWAAMESKRYGGFKGTGKERRLENR